MAKRVKKRSERIPGISYKEFSEKDLSFISLITLAGQLGLMMIANIILCFFIIRWLLGILHFDIRFQIFGLLAGIISGGYSCYRIIAKQLELKDNDK